MSIRAIDNFGVEYLYEKHKEWKFWWAYERKQKNL